MASLTPGLHYRFEVGSAEEAVRVIRERMGSKGRVVSVRQMNGSGLKRFLASPRLEVVATIPVEPAAPPPSAPADVSAQTRARLLQAVADAAAHPGGAGEERPEPVNAAPGAAYQAAANTEGAGAGVGRSKTPPVGAPRTPGGLLALLRQIGFEESLLAALEGQSEWRQTEALPTSAGIGRAAVWLRREATRMVERPLGERIAFLGPQGSGKTSALCRRLASEVFLENRMVRVLKLEADSPNPDHTLGVYCEALGVELLRHPEEIAQGEGRLYCDLPGLSENDPEEWKPVCAELDRLEIQTRVLVLNAAYETEALKRQARFGAQLGATHLVLTHFDEVQRPARLWSLLLRSGLSPWFLTHGPNLAGDHTEDVVAHLLDATFPRSLVER